MVDRIEHPCPRCGSLLCREYCDDTPRLPPPPEEWERLRARVAELERERDAARSNNERHIEAEAQVAALREALEFVRDHLDSWTTLDLKGHCSIALAAHTEPERIKATFHDEICQRDHESEGCWWDIRLGAPDPLATRPAPPAPSPDAPVPPRSAP